LLITYAKWEYQREMPFLSFKYLFLLKPVLKLAFHESILLVDNAR
jgi:hypothetical protein